MAPPGILDLVEASSSLGGAIRFLPEDERHPVARIWEASEVTAGWVTRRVGPGGTLAAVLEPSFAALATLLGTWRAGATFASLPARARGMAEDVYVEQLRRVCEVAGATTLVTGEDLSVLAREVRGTTAETFASALVPDGPVQLQGGTGALVQLTSGSTGHPKGVRLSMEAIGGHVAALGEVLEIDTGDSICSWLPLSHDMGLIGMCLTALAAGGTGAKGLDLHLMAPEQFASAPWRWLRACAETGATMTGAPNFALDIAVRVHRRPEELDLSRLRVVVTGAERVRGPTLRAFNAAFGLAGLAEAAVCPAYGLAEATLAVTLTRPGKVWSEAFVDRDALARDEWTVVDADHPGAVSIVSCGSPMPKADVRSDAPGVGVLAVRGPSLLEDYVGAELSLDDGWFRTSDLGHVGDDGEVYVVGRCDDVVVLGGRNHYASDMELAAQHRLVHADAAMAAPTDDGQLLLFAEPRKKMTEPEAHDLAVELRASLQRTCGVAPAGVVLLPRGGISRTPSGKKQRSKTAAAYAGGELPAVFEVFFGSRPG